MSKLAALLLLAVAAHAADLCPVFNSATAAGLLGGAVTLAITHGADDDNYTCAFTRASSELAIAVSTTQHFACPAADATPLKAIGNEAYACTLPRAPAIAEQVTGRVRNQFFQLTLITRDPAIPHPIARDKLRAAAESVAGNLF